MTKYFKDPVEFLSAGSIKASIESLKKDNEEIKEKQRLIDEYNKVWDEHERLIAGGNDDRRDRRNGY